MFLQDPEGAMMICFKESNWALTVDPLFPLTLADLSGAVLGTFDRRAAVFGREALARVFPDKVPALTAVPSLLQPSYFREFEADSERVYAASLFFLLPDIPGLCIISSKAVPALQGWELT